MRIKYKNIKLASFICLINFFVLVFFHFAEDVQLLKIGEWLESLIGISTNISVSKMQSFLEIIFSGVLGSTLVALFFYIQDYYFERERTINKVMDNIDDSIRLYSNIPYCRYFCSNKYAKLAKAYYCEFYNHEQYKELKKKADEYIKKVPKSCRRHLRQESDEMFNSNKPSHDAEKRLRAFLKDQYKEDICEQKILSELETIIKEIDYKSEKAIKAYKQIMATDYSELNRLRFTVVEFGSYTWRRKAFLKEKIKDCKIYPNLYYTPKDYISNIIISLKKEHRIDKKVLSALLVCDKQKCNTANITNHTYDIIHRIQTYISVHFDSADFNQLKTYNKKEIVDLLSCLQQSFIFEDKTKIALNLQDEINYVYNKPIYYISNLKMILLFILYNHYEFLPPTHFMIPNEGYNQNSYVSTKAFSGDDFSKDFYRL